MEINLKAYKVEIEEFVRLDLNDVEMLRRALHKLIKKIDISLNGEITVYYNFNNPLE